MSSLIRRGTDATSRFLIDFAIVSDGESGSDSWPAPRSAKVVPFFGSIAL